MRLSLNTDLAVEVNLLVWSLHVPRQIEGDLQDWLLVTVPSNG